MPSLRSLYKEYLTSLPLAGLHVNSGARRWTESVKIYWAQKGDENGFQVWANRVNYRSRNFTGHEYMLDLIWRRTNIQTNQIQLALECEWQSRKEPQEHDFQKLVYVKARQKVFIFQFYRDRDPVDRVRELMRFAKKCRIKQEPEEEYLLISHRDDRRKGLVETVDGFIAYANGGFDHISEERVPIR